MRPAYLADGSVDETTSSPPSARLPTAHTAMEHPTPTRPPEPGHCWGDGSIGSARDFSDLLLMDTDLAGHGWVVVGGTDVAFGSKRSGKTRSTAHYFLDDADIRN
jgi:hypothetical protein